MIQELSKLDPRLRYASLTGEENARKIRIISLVISDRESFKIQHDQVQGKILCPNPTPMLSLFPMVSIGTRQLVISAIDLYTVIVPFFGFKNNN